MKLITNRIFTGKPTKTIPDLLKMAQARNKLEKTASVNEEEVTTKTADKEWFEKNVLNKGKEKDGDDEGEKKEGCDDMKAASKKETPVKLATDVSKETAKSDFNKDTEKYDAGKTEGKLVGHPKECKENSTCEAEKKDDPAVEGVGTTKTEDGTFPSSGQLSLKIPGNAPSKPRMPTDKDVNAKTDSKKGKIVEAQFDRIANLTPKQKTFLKTYWRNLYGEDYASAMVVDK